MISTALFTSASDEWATPQDFFDRLNAEFAFTLDVAATIENAKTEYFMTEADDALAQPWRRESKSVWCNPPYSAIDKWVAKAHEESQKGATVVMLIPARTDTKYWHAHVMKASEIRLVKGRLKFGEGKNSAPFPSAVVIFRPHWNHPPILTTMDAKAK